MDEKQALTGNCYLCGKSLKESEMKNHIMKEHDAGEEECFLIKAESAEFLDYWIYFDIPKTKTLQHIDRFLRDIWLECCGHLSRFAQSYRSYDDIGKSRPVGSFKAGEKIYYEYDMGTTTSLYIKFIRVIRRPKQAATIRLLARNEAPDLRCSVCGKPAEFICTECMYDPDMAEKSMFCKKHSAEHEHDDMLMPITNSPRNAECGYTGEFDVYEFTGDPKRDIKTSAGKTKKSGRASVREIYDDFGEDTDDPFDSGSEESGSLIELFEKLLTGGLSESDLTGEYSSGLFDEIKDSLTLPGEPVFSIKEILSKSTVAELRETAKEAGVKNYSKMKKNDLVLSVMEYTLSEGFLKRIFGVMPESDLNLIKSEIDKDGFYVTDSFFENPFLIEARVYNIFLVADGYYCVIPTEIKEAYKNFADEEFFESRRKIQEFGRCADAAVNLYGIIKIEDFVKIYNRYTGLKSDADNSYKLLDALGMFGSQFGIYDDLLLHGIMFDTDDIDALITCFNDLKKDKPAYIPSTKEEFLKNECPDCFEASETAPLREALTKNGFDDPDKIDELIADIILNMKCEIEKPTDCAIIFDAYEVRFKSQKAKKAAVVLAEKLRTNVRMWKHNGHTPNETAVVPK